MASQTLQTLSWASVVRSPLSSSSIACKPMVMPVPIPVPPPPFTDYVAEMLASKPRISIKHSVIMSTFTEANKKIRELVSQHDALQSKIDSMKTQQKELELKRCVLNTEIDDLFTHGAPGQNLQGRYDPLIKHFRCIFDTTYREARRLLNKLLTSVYFREVAMLLIALMALRGQVNDGDRESACFQNVNRELANAWALHLTDPVLIRLYNEACKMSFYTLWRHKFSEIWKY